MDMLRQVGLEEHANKKPNKLAKHSIKIITTRIAIIINKIFSIYIHLSKQSIAYKQMFVNWVFNFLIIFITPPYWFFNSIIPK